MIKNTNFDYEPNIFDRRNANMKVVMSKFLQKQKPFVKQLVEKLSSDYAYVSVLGTDSFGKQYSAQRSGTSLNDSMWTERGFVVRIHNGINYSEYAFNEIPDGGIDEIISNIKSTVIKGMDTLKSSKIKVNEYKAIEEEKIQKVFYADVECDMDSISRDQKIARLVAIKDKGLKFSDEIIDFRARYSEIHISKMFISTNKDLEQSYIIGEGMILPIVRRGNQTKYNYQSYSGLKSVELLDEMESGIEECAELAIKLLDAKPPVPGEYDIICSPDLAGLIAHEAFGHGVEMDMFVRGRAKAINYMNKRVASDLVTMYDGAKAAQHVSSYLFDDEGVIGTNTVVIDKGILKNGLSDILSAERLGTVPTGNGKRQSYDRKAYARMTNTLFDSGNDTLEDMIASVKYGYLIDRGMSGMEDPKNWGIQCMLNFGREIKDGKFTGNIVSPVIMTGYVPDLLQSISMISGDIALSGSGYCGKGYKEFVKVSCGGPYIKAKGMIG